MSVPSSGRTRASWFRKWVKGGGELPELIPYAPGINSGNGAALSGPGPGGQGNQAFVIRAKKELSGAMVRFLFLPDPRGPEGQCLFACV